MVFYVDGGCRENGNPDAIGAAAACLMNRLGKTYKYKSLQLLRWAHRPTNQEAEITAIILALKWALERWDELDNQPRLSEDLLRFTIRHRTFDHMLDKWERNGWMNSKGIAVMNEKLIMEASELDGQVRKLGTLYYLWTPREYDFIADLRCNEALGGLDDFW
ncbi:ribonuclease H-like domain-containing protein [Xylariales sp. AK1849]|nr:ribonuclease H-like domain-containing protein [Xylariales sp. AK1849]